MEHGGGGSRYDLGKVLRFWFHVTMVSVAERHSCTRATSRPNVVPGFPFASLESSRKGKGRGRVKGRENEKGNEKGIEKGNEKGTGGDDNNKTQEDSEGWGGLRARLPAFAKNSSRIGHMGIRVVNLCTVVTVRRRPQRPRIGLTQSPPLHCSVPSMISVSVPTAAVATMERWLGPGAWSLEPGHSMPVHLDVRRL